MSEFPWGAVATICAGVLAIGGVVFASKITRAQVRIAERQASIASRQVGLQELTLRANLFDRRYAVYKATKDALSQALNTRRRPPPGDPIETAFLIAKDEAKFLFRPAAEHELQAIWERICQAQAVHSSMEHLFQTQGHYGEFPAQELANSLWMLDRLSHLSAVFGDELRLSIVEI